MSTLADFSGPGLVIPALRSLDAATVVAELTQTLEQSDRITDAHEFCSAVLRRELLCSTACSPGFALPHARLDGIERLTFAVGRCVEPLMWFGATEPVRLVFLFAVPQDAAAACLNVVSGIARLSQEAARVQQLLAAADSDALFQLLREIQLRPAGRVSRTIACAR